MRSRPLNSLYLVLTLLLAGSSFAIGEQNQPKAPTSSRIIQTIDAGNRVTLQGHVLKTLTPERDMGAVEDSKPTRLYLNLKRTPAQQADLDALIAHQQQPGSPEYHKWLTPQQFGARFGASQDDIHKVSLWLASQGFEVTSVAHNASVINFMATAGSIRHTFHADLHYWNVGGGKHIVTATEPEIPVALSHVISGIAGLNQIPMREHHTPVTRQAYDASTHKWHTVDTAAAAASTAGETPHYLDGFGRYVVTPQDFYSIYNVNPTFAAGNTGAGSTVAIISDTNFMFGTVDPTTGQATGGDVATFRSLFGVPGTLNMTVQHGDVAYPCSDPGGDSGETALDSEWSNALAPNAHLIVATCSDADGGALNALQALINDNVADVISSSLGAPETVIGSGELSVWNTILPQAAAQGQTFLVAEGDSGDDDLDFGSPGPATHGLSIDFPGSHPYALSIGGTDFQDLYDQDKAGTPQSTYWGANSKYYGNALGYIPETVWEDSCASSLFANDPYYGNGLSPLAYCETPMAQNAAVSGGGEGGISVIYNRPSYQTGIQGLSASIIGRVTPDISGFAAGGYWGHLTVVCDSGDPNAACTSPSTFGGAGGTSFASPELAGVFTLLKNANGRQGLVQPTLYALAKAQYSQTGAACYANGQAGNNGVTTGLPASSCIFHDVTTGNNQNPCQVGSPNCYTEAGQSIGLLTASGDNSVLAIAYPAGPGYDIATGLGSVNVTNLINKWNTAFTSSTSLTANPTSITTAQSTTLTATVTVGQPPNSVSPAPTLAGSVSFATGATALGSCTLNGTTCSISVAGSALPIGSDPIIATFAGSGSYPSSTSNTVIVTVSSAQQAQTITFGALPNVTYGVSPIALTATASSGLPVTYTVTGPATVSGSTLTITGKGAVTVTASQAGNASFTAATPVSQSFTVAAAALTVTANNASRPFGAANPAFTYTVTGFVNSDPSSVVSGSATETTTATSTSPAGSYPITFATKGLTATNYTFTYFNGTLTVSGNASQTINFGALANKTYGAGAFALTATASSGLPVTYTATGPATVSGSTLTITGAGFVTVTASQAGNGNYAAATPVSQNFTVAKASLTATAANASKVAGTANPTFTYTVAGFVNGDTSSVVGGSATLTSTATTSSPAGSYPITFATTALTATNYTFTYVAGTLTVTGTNQCSFINYSNGFTPGGLQLNGGATIANGVLQLTDGKTSEARSAFFKTPVPLAGFVTDFTFQLLNPVADGFAIVLQANNPSIVGVGGGGLGYAGINHSSAVKFDLYNNNGEGTNSTGYYFNGANPTTPSIDLTPSGINLHSGHIFAVHFTFNGSVAAWTVTDTVTKAVFSTSVTPKPNPFTGNVYVGFTAGTGGNAATQNILSWTYNSGPGCPVN